jgi:hypothetical protein
MVQHITVLPKNPRNANCKVGTLTYPEMLGGIMWVLVISQPEHELNLMIRITINIL